MAGTYLKRLFPGGLCSGTTKAGARCRVRDVFENGRCRGHGGTGALLRELHKAGRDLEREKIDACRRSVFAYLRDHPEAFPVIARLIEAGKLEP